MGLFLIHKYLTFLLLYDSIYTERSLTEEVYMASIEQLAREVMHELKRDADGDIRTAMNTVLDRHGQFYKVGIRKEIARTLATWKKRPKTLRQHLEEVRAIPQPPPVFPRAGSVLAPRAERKHYLEELEDRRDELAEEFNKGNA